MTATPARIGFVQQEFRSVTWSDQNVRALYGKVARDTGDAPIDTFFDDMAAVQLMANERGALLGKHSRAFRTRIDRLIDVNGTFAMATALPGVVMVDDELAANMTCAVVSIESYDTGAEQSVVATWGVL